MSRRQRPIVAIDGPAGVGKSTTSRELARRLNFTYVDTGALYRGLAFAARSVGVSWDDGEALTHLAKGLRLAFGASSDGAPTLLIEGVDRSREIRTPEISQGASRVSSHPAVRAQLLHIQRELGKNGGVVMEGRDIGTVVFPDAEIKVFVTASPEERASRRALELQHRGLPANHGEVLKEIESRDDADSSRAVAPLKAAKDSVILDTTSLGFDAVVQHLEQMVHRWISSQNESSSS